MKFFSAVNFTKKCADSRDFFIKLVNVKFLYSLSVQQNCLKFPKFISTYLKLRAIATNRFEVQTRDLPVPLNRA